MVKPFQVLLTLFAVAALCVVAMLVFPVNGIKLNNDVTLNFPQYNSFFEDDTTAVLDVDSLLNSYEEPIDSTQIKDSIQRFQLRHRQKMLSIQFASNQTHLSHFYQSLLDLKSGKRSKVRILHYGDSQIEGDRITSYIRQKLQAEYGGSGPGMLPLMQFIPNMSIVQTQSENWLRYTAFGRKDTTVNHNGFGLRGIVSRFTPYVQNQDLAALETVKATVQLKPSRLGYSSVKRYKKMRIHYGNAKMAVYFTIKVGEDLVYADSLKTGENSFVFEYTFDNTPEEINLEFTGKYSPDFYAVSLESTTGVIVDNVAMRGSSGTIFSKINNSQLRYQYGKEPITLVLLQYGGNTVPYIDSEKKAKDYGRWFGAQIAYLKRLLPNADFVLLGPSDMAKKEKTEFITYPYLPKVRDALKEAAFKEGAGFWDIYEVMGGKNSMPSWVNADPPLAGTDYVHFTPKGAKRIAELFYSAIENDFAKYKIEVEKQKQNDLKKTDSTLTVKDTLKVAH